MAHKRIGIARGDGIDISSDITQSNIGNIQQYETGKSPIEK